MTSYFKQTQIKILRDYKLQRRVITVTNWTEKNNIKVGLGSHKH